MIKLTNTSKGAEKTNLYIPFGKIEGIALFREGMEDPKTMIHMDSGKCFAVSETPEEVLKAYEHSIT